MELSAAHIGSWVTVIDAETGLPLDSGDIKGIRDNGYTVELDSNSKRVFVLPEFVIIETESDSVTRKAESLDPKPSSIGNRISSLTASVLDQATIDHKVASLEARILSYKAAIDKAQADIKAAKGIPAIVRKHAGRVARMKISDAAARVEILEQEEVKEILKGLKG